MPSVVIKWENIGVLLLSDDLVNNGALKVIKENNSKSKECCKNMFQKWLDTNEDANWKQLIDALQSPDVDLTPVAAQIKSRLQIRGETVNIYFTYY